MNSHFNCPVFFRLAVFVAATGLAIGSGVAPPVAQAQTVRNAEDLLIVDCLLPGQIRRLGAQVTYMSARRPVRTTQADCQIRGGEYVSFDRANYQTALKVWRDSADAGDPEAMNYVGEIYLKGLGIDPDYSMAKVWFEKAVEKGNNRAKINLGYLYEAGLGVPKDVAHALNLYREASGIGGDDLIYASTVQVELQEKETQITELKQTVQSQQEQIKQLQADLDAKKQALESSQHDLDATQSKLAKVRASVGAEVARKVEAARAQMQSSADDLAQAEGGDAAANADQIANLKKQLAAQRTQFQAQVNGMKARAPAKSKQDYELMKLLEFQLVDKQAQVNQQNRSIASLQARISAGANGGAEQAANSTLVMISPQVFATRGANTGVVHGAPGAHDLVGRVTNPAAVAKVTVNGTPVSVGANGAFKAQVNVPAGGASVQVAMVGKAGDRKALDFNVIMQAGGDSAVAGDAGAGRVGAVPAGVRLGDNYAVIIGNDTYQDAAFADLKSAASDATAVSQVLKTRYGYHTTLLSNATRLEILTALNNMREKLGPDDNLLVYYAGHGELQGRQGYWIPTDARDKTASTWISNAAISDILTTIKSRHVLVVADSCYSGTLARSGVPSFDNGALKADQWASFVKDMLAGKSRTVMTSGGVQPVLDTGAGTHSYFTRAFVNALQDNTRMLQARRLYRDVSSAVALASLSSPIEQTPGYAPIQFAGHESGDFFFVPSGAKTAQINSVRHVSHAQLASRAKVRQVQ